MVIVVTRTQFTPELLGTMEDLTRRSIPIFEKQNGFISMEVKKDLGDQATLTVFQWASLEDHENCMKSPDWGALNEEWGSFMGREDVNFEILFTGVDWKRAAK